MGSDGKKAVQEQYELLHAWAETAVSSLMDTDTNEHDLTREEFAIHGVVYLMVRMIARVIKDSVENKEQAVETTIEILREEFSISDEEFLASAVPSGKKKPGDGTLH